MKKIIRLCTIILALIFMSGCQQAIYSVKNTILTKDKPIEDIYNLIKQGAENAN